MANKKRKDPDNEPLGMADLIKEANMEHERRVMEGWADPRVDLNTFKPRSKRTQSRIDDQGNTEEVSLYPLAENDPNLFWKQSAVRGLYPREEAERLFGMSLPEENAPATEQERRDRALLHSRYAQHPELLAEPRYVTFPDGTSMIMDGRDWLNYQYEKGWLDERLPGSETPVREDWEPAVDVPGTDLHLPLPKQRAAAEEGRAQPAPVREPEAPRLQGPEPVRAREPEAPAPKMPEPRIEPQPMIPEPAKEPEPMLMPKPVPAPREPEPVAASPMLFGTLGGGWHRPPIAQATAIPTMIDMYQGAASAFQKALSDWYRQMQPGKNSRTSSYYDRFAE